MKYLFLILVSTSLHATTFKKVSLEAQLKEADGVLIGHFLKSRSVKLDDGTIATQMVFKMNKEVGFRSDLFGMDEVIIHYPGGTYDGVTTQVQGTPQFVVGEKVALLSKSVDNRYWGLNLAYGSFKIINYGKDTMVINSLFPNDPQGGQQTIEEFEKKVKEVKALNFKVVLSPDILAPQPTQAGRSIASEDEGKNRSVASQAEASENEGSTPSSGVFWLVVILAFLGGAVRLLKPRST